MTSTHNCRKLLDNLLKFLARMTPALNELTNKFYSYLKGKIYTCINETISAALCTNVT